MKRLILLGLAFVVTFANAQEIYFDYDRGTNFHSYKTYQWVASPAAKSANQLLDQHIRDVVDAQLALKHLRGVESGGNLQVTYRTAVDTEKQFDGWGRGPRIAGINRVTTSTINVGMLVIDVYDSTQGKLVWRGWVRNTLDIKKDPDKNYRNLQKAVAKLLVNYPPPSIRQRARENR